MTELKQGTKLKGKISNETYYIGGVVGEMYFVVNNDGRAHDDNFTIEDINRMFTIIEEQEEWKEGDVYFFTDDFGYLDKTLWRNDDIDIYRRDYLGIYRTESACEEARKNQKKINEK